MNYSSLKFPDNKPRYRIKNVARFTAVILVFLLTITAVLVILAKIKGNGNDKYGVKPTETIDISTLPLPRYQRRLLILFRKESHGALFGCIDPGHGDLDGGTVSPYIDGLYEKDIVLDIAKKLSLFLPEKG